MTALKRGSRAAEGKVESPGTADRRMEICPTAAGAVTFGRAVGFANEVVEEKGDVSLRCIPAGRERGSSWLPAIFDCGERRGPRGRSGQAFRVEDCEGHFNERVVEAANREEALLFMRTRARYEQRRLSIGRGRVRSPTPPFRTFLSRHVPSPLHIGGADQERGAIAARLMRILVRAVGSPMDWFGL